MTIRNLTSATRRSGERLGLWAVAFAFDPKATLPEAGIRQLMDRYQRRLRLLSPLSFELQMPEQEWSARFPELTTALQTLTYL